MHNNTALHMSMSMEGWETVGTNLFLYPVGCQRFVTHSEYLNTTYLQQGSLHIRICKTLYVYFLLIRKGGKLGGGGGGYNIYTL